ncbi:hypothetical protein EYF80_029650 [Liparis tanakae]|uniref:Uncharacterized protein n=1 Tax=Liparis tanakae TaxID=230148 RepID=A0A4Z2H2K6_9TELE|nr:hypothetical protein EYF80_029650 [Liparis tanakae]
MARLATAGPGTHGAKPELKYFGERSDDPAFPHVQLIALVAVPLTAEERGHPEIRGPWLFAWAPGYDRRSVSTRCDSHGAEGPFDPLTPGAGGKCA